jgi:hypothetical protein
VQRRSWPESVRNSDLGPDLAALIGSIAANNFNGMGDLHDFPSWDRAEHGSGASTWAMMAIGFTGFLGFRRRNAATA